VRVPANGHFTYSPGGRLHTGVTTKVTTRGLPFP
jgi:hypothetical protein